jgi:hypothetical protein
LKISRAKASRLALTALLLAGVAVPAVGQQDKPESLLPPGFDQPVPAQAPTPAPSRPADPATPPPIAAVPLPDDLDLGNASDLGNGQEAAAEPVDLSQYELPDYARHSLARVGAFASGNAAFPADAFGATDGRVLQALLRRLDAPIASRWASIVLRRALMSPLDTPSHIDGADFAAERAWVLLRMGEAVAARAVVNDVDTDNYTTLLYQVAMQAGLATGDPGAFCPIADDAAAIIHQRGWALAQAMCMGLRGKPSEAGQLLNAARQGTSSSDIDNLLAEKVLGTGAEGRRAVTIEWAGITRLTAWRWGLATATGVEVPAELYATAGRQVRYWQALSPSIAPAARAQAAELAATSGVFSNAGLVDLYGDIDADSDATGPEANIARDLRTAYTDGDAGDRVKAIQGLWDQAQTPRTQYARLILTARAASWIPANDKVATPERLIASMLSAGYDGAAMEWRGVVKPGSEGWALLALADSSTSAVAFGDFDAYRGAASPRKAQMLLAGLAGLGRLNASDAERGAQAADVRIGGANAWTRAIDAAGRKGEPGAVALLAAVGMQAPNWDYVTPEAQFHIVAAMRAAGMANYARMIAVEAVTRTA